MNGFAYFIPNRQAATPAQLADLLPHAFDAAGPATTRHCAGGPDGQAGILATTDVEAAPKWQPNTTAAEYRGMPKGVALVYDPANKPGPDDLLRPEPIDGYNLALADGRQWIIPLARVFPTGTALPSRLAFGPDGQWVKEPLDHLRQASADADRIWDAIRTHHGMLEEAEKPTEIDEAETTEMACRILALNYRIAAAEASVLGILTTANVIDILRWFVDFPRFYTTEIDAKKNETDNAAGPPTISGSAASPATTDRPAPNGSDS